MELIVRYKNVDMLLSSPQSHKNETKIEGSIGQERLMRGLELALVLAVTLAPAICYTSPFLTFAI